MTKQPSVYFEKMVFLTERLIEAGEKFSEKDLDDFWIGAGVAKVIEELGENANKLGRDKQSEYPHIPWREIIGMRNILVHHYESAESEIMWKVITVSAPKLLPMLQKAFAHELTQEQNLHTKS